MIRIERDDSGISDVVGAMLMMAIIFILVLSVSSYVLLSPDASPEQVNADVEFIEQEDDTVTVRWTRPLTAERVIINNGTDEFTLNNINEEVTLQPGPDGRDINVYAQGQGTTSFLTRYDVGEVKTTVYMESSTCDSPGYCGSTIKFNGSTIWSGRGVNVLVLKPNGAFYSYASYDTHSRDRYKSPTGSLDGSGEPAIGGYNTCSACANDRLMNHLNSTPDGYTIILVGDDQPGRSGGATNGINDLVEAEYEQMGAQFGGDNELNHRDSWLLVTEKQDDNNYTKVFEKHAPRGRDSGIAKVVGYFTAPQDD